MLHIGVGVDFDEFNPSLTLVPGQSFNWRRLGTDDSWVGSLDGHPLIFAKDETQSRVACLDGSISGKELSALVHNYLQLDVNIKELYALVSPLLPARMTRITSSTCVIIISGLNAALGCAPSP